MAALGVGIDSVRGADHRAGEGRRHRDRFQFRSKHVAAFNGESGDVSVIDPPTYKVVVTIALGSGPEFAGADCKGMLFVNLEDKSETLAIDVQTNTVTHRWPLAPGESPSGLAVDGGKGRVFAGCRNEQMVVLDAASGKVLATLAIGQGVDACVFDPGTGFAFASCGDGTLTVVKEEAGSFLVVEKIPASAFSDNAGAQALGSSSFTCKNRASSGPLPSSSTT